MLLETTSDQAATDVMKTQRQSDGVDGLTKYQM
jgi:hypothetical protein